MPKPIVIILLGPPGAGKGTQGELLSERLSLYYFETSRILEQTFDQPGEQEFIEVEGKRYFFAKEKELWHKGILCSPPFVTHLVKERIKQLHQQGEGLLLSGSPRTMYEAEVIVPLLKELYGTDNIKIILLDISAEETIFRNSHRRLCELMRHPILYDEETKELDKCPLDGSTLVRRQGLDEPENIKTRLKEYKERTLPLIDFCKEQGLEIKEIDGSPPPADVFAAILKVLK